MGGQVRAGAKRSGGQARWDKAEQPPCRRIPTEDRLPGPSIDTEDRLPGPSMDQPNDPTQLISPGLAIPCAATHGQHPLDHGHHL